MVKNSILILLFLSLMIQACAKNSAFFEVGGVKVYPDNISTQKAQEIFEEFKKGEDVGGEIYLITTWNSRDQSECRQYYGAQAPQCEASYLVAVNDEEGCNPTYFVVYSSELDNKDDKYIYRFIRSSSEAC